MPECARPVESAPAPAGTEPGSDLGVPGTIDEGDDANADGGDEAETTP